jgi:hypothetical protein
MVLFFSLLKHIVTAKNVPGSKLCVHGRIDRRFVRLIENIFGCCDRWWCRI